MNIWNWLPCAVRDCYKLVAGSIHVSQTFIYLQWTQLQLVVALPCTLLSSFVHRAWLKISWFPMLKVKLPDYQIKALEQTADGCFCAKIHSKPWLIHLICGQGIKLHVWMSHETRVWLLKPGRQWCSMCEKWRKGMQIWHRVATSGPGHSWRFGGGAWGGIETQQGRNSMGSMMATCNICHWLREYWASSHTCVIPLLANNLQEGYWLLSFVFSLHTSWIMAIPTRLIWLSGAVLWIPLPSCICNSKKILHRWLLY